MSSAFDELQKIVNDVGKDRLVGQKGVVKTVHVHCLNRHVALGIDVAVEKSLGSVAEGSADNFRAADFHDSIIFISVKSRGFRIQTNDEFS